MGNADSGQKVPTYTSRAASQSADMQQTTRKPNRYNPSLTSRTGQHSMNISDARSQVLSDVKNNLPVNPDLVASLGYQTAPNSGLCGSRTLA